MVGINDLAYLCQSVHCKRVSDLHWTNSLQWACLDGVLAFAGSDSLTDWWHNLRLWPVKSPTGPGWVHAGWLDLTRQVWPTLRNTVLGGQKIYAVTGYSLGAAIALLVAEKLRKVKVVTFGSPAVGSEAWVKRYPHPVVRCSVETDLVTKPILGRRHVGFPVSLPGGWNPVKNHLSTLHRRWP